MGWSLTWWEKRGEWPQQTPQACLSSILSPPCPKTGIPEESHLPTVLHKWKDPSCYHPNPPPHPDCHSSYTSLNLQITLQQKTCSHKVSSVGVSHCSSINTHHSQTLHSLKDTLSCHLHKRTWQDRWSAPVVSLPEAVYMLISRHRHLELLWFPTKFHQLGSSKRWAGS